MELQTSKKKQLMNEAELQEMQQRIDDGIRLAQERLIERQVRLDGTLIVARDGEVMEVPAKELKENQSLK